jgi:hypothetical protein
MNAGLFSEGPGPAGKPQRSGRDRQKRPTQREKVVRLLLSADACSSKRFLNERIPRAAAVIFRLRGDGYTIVSRPCTRGHDHSSPQIKYVLEALPFDPKEVDIGF